MTVRHLDKNDYYTMGARSEEYGVSVYNKFIAVGYTHARTGRPAAMRHRKWSAENWPSFALFTSASLLGS